MITLYLIMAADGDKIYVLDSRDRVFDHSLSSDNTTSDFVVRLQENINKMRILSAEIPISYYAVNENSRYIYFRDSFNNYYQATLGLGNYDTTSFLTALANALTSAEQLPVPGIIYPDTFTITYSDITNKFILETTDASGVQFITISDPNNPNGIPLGLIPGDITGLNPVLSPRRDTINNTARLIGLPFESVVPNPNIDTDGFPIGINFGYSFGSPASLPNGQNISGDNYLFIRSDNVGTTNFRQGINVTVDPNESDFTVIQDSFKDNGIIQKIQIDQIIWTVLTPNFDNSPDIFLTQSTNEINIRLTYRDNLPVDLNGVDMSITIAGQ